VRILANGCIRKYGSGFVCLAVVLFVVHVKLDLYGHCSSHNHAPHTTSWSKLRPEGNPSKNLMIPPVQACWLGTAFTFVLLLHGQPLVQRVFSSLIAHDASLRYQRRFFRPPPPLLF
jgi:hypothetical protein